MKIVIEINGGVLQAVYSDINPNDLDVLLVDWDNIKEGGVESDTPKDGKFKYLQGAVDCTIDSLEFMPEDTKNAIKKYTGIVEYNWEKWVY